MAIRDTILEAVLKNQPASTPLPDISMFMGDENAIVRRYTDVFTGIGGSVYQVDNFDTIKILMKENFDGSKRTITTLPELVDVAETIVTTADPHSFEDVELAVIRGEFCVAENGAVWITETLMGQRIIPYICQHLAVVVNEKDILPTLHEAYERIGTADHGFSGFIAGPSKTADIEQALVLGAHGPLTMTVFIMA